MANKDKKNSTSFKAKNKAAEKWTLAESKTAFEELVRLALLNNDWLCLQDVTLYNDIIPYRTFYYLLEKYPVLHSFKNELNDIIISRINKGAVLSEFNPTASIWRMKQLGETDKQEIKTDNSHNINQMPVINFINTDNVNHT